MCYLHQNRTDRNEPISSYKPDAEIPQSESMEWLYDSSDLIFEELGWIFSEPIDNACHVYSQNFIQ